MVLINPGSATIRAETLISSAKRANSRAGGYCSSMKKGALMVRAKRPPASLVNDTTVVRSSSELIWALEKVLWFRRTVAGYFSDH
jgi:hypothetical protein